MDKQGQQELTKEELEEHKQKLKMRFGDKTRTGGKGSQRRKIKALVKPQVADDKKLKTIFKKQGTQPLQGIEEVNLFKDDKSIIQFRMPEDILKIVMANWSSNSLVVIGKPETKSTFFSKIQLHKNNLDLKDLLPDIMQHLGTKQWKQLQEEMKKSFQQNKEGQNVEPIKEEDENQEEIPTLVGDQNFEEISKQVD